MKLQIELTLECSDSVDPDHLTAELMEKLLVWFPMVFWQLADYRMEGNGDEAG